MEKKNVVLKSVNSPDGGLCVDIFLRPDGTFGFEEYRRDVEDEKGWFPIGFFGERIFNNESDALNEAQIKVAWLKGVIRNAY